MRMNKIVWGNSKFVSGVILYSSLTVQTSNVKYPPASFNFSIQLWLFLIENTNTQIINWAPVITAVFRLWIWFVEVGLGGFSCGTAALTSSALVFDSRTYNQYNDLRSVRWPLDMRWLRWRFRSPPAYAASLPSLLWIWTSPCDKCPNSLNSICTSSSLQCKLCSIDQLSY